MKKLLLLLLRAYQLIVSPLLGQNCRFYPSCSHYAMDAVSVHGAAKGGWLALKRVGRCHPWHEGGFDPVPPADPKANAEADAAVAAPPSSTTACGCNHT